MSIAAADIREHVDTDLSDDSVDRLIADAVDAIDERVGASGEQTVVLRSEGRFIFLPQPVASDTDIDTIVERWDASEVTLDDDQWRLIGRRQIERLIGSGSPVATTWGWGQSWPSPDIQIVVTYTPRADANRRDRVTIDLVRLAIVSNGLSAERAGDYSSSSVEYQRERDRIITELTPRLGVA